MKDKIHRFPFRGWSTGLLLVAVILASGILSHVVPMHAQSVPQLSGRIAISGQMVPALQHTSPMHAMESSQQLQLSIALNLRNESELHTLLQEQNNPGSLSYHHYLTPQEFTQRFGPTMDTVNQATAYLKSQGLQVGSVASNHTLIHTSGSAGAVEKAFNTNIGEYQLKGRVVYAPMAQPSVPASLGNIILNIGGLDDVAHYHPLLTPHADTGPGGGYTPTSLRTAYDMDSLLSSATGSGQTIAIYELDGYKSSDVNQYLSNYGLGSAKYSNVLVDGATNTAGSGAIEVELDMEVISAIAPGATQKIYIGPNTNTGVNDTYNQIVTDDTAPIVSISWGECESASGNAELAALDNIFAQGAAQGQSFFAAAGDSGAYDCGTSSLAVDSPASDPNVVGVGGTALQLNSDNTYSSESAWSSGTGAGGSGGGGGYSSYFAIPAYQTGSGIDSNAQRHVPDVSADADPNTGYSIYCSVAAAGCSTGTAAWTVVGGTSAAAPLWAGLVADVNDYLSQQGLNLVGNMNAKLYSLFNTSQMFPAYHDVTTGSNLFYQAGSGYDLATGIGTPDAWDIAQDLQKDGI
jgi:kumamolisin